MDELSLAHISLASSASHLSRLSLAAAATHYDYYYYYDRGWEEARWVAASFATPPPCECVRGREWWWFMGPRHREREDHDLPHQEEGTGWRRDRRARRHGELAREQLPRAVWRVYNFLGIILCSSVDYSVCLHVCGVYSVLWCSFADRGDEDFYAEDQNSNDSSSGPAPGTPNSQGMRPTPSPTGSTGSRSMSPAVGQQNIPMPPRPSSGQSDSSGPTRMSHSPMATQGGYQQALVPPPHMHGYKMGVHPGVVPPAAGQSQISSYSPQGQQYPQGGYGGRPPQGQIGGYGVSPGQGYGSTGPQGGSPQVNNMGGGGSGPGGGASGQYPPPGRGVPNHVPQGQYGGYQGWGSQGMNQGPPPGLMGGPGGQMPPGKGGPPQGQNVNSVSGPRPHTPPHYLKQHLQSKMGFSGSSTISQSPGPPQGYGGSGSISSAMGPPPGHSGMGPPGPHSMGPPPISGHHHSGMGPPPPAGGMVVSATTSIPPISSSVPPSQSPSGPPHSVASGPSIPNSHDSPQVNMPPPSSTPNSMAAGGHGDGPHAISSGQHPEGGHDNGITTTATGTTTTNVTPAMPGSVTSVITTGPDGTPLDEGSQQSTLSNASAASGDDQGCGPKSRKDMQVGMGGGMGGVPGGGPGGGGGGVVSGGPLVGGYPSHPPTPQSTVPSPGAASINSMHGAEEYGDVNSPTSWPRTPASPVFNSHVSQDPYRPKKLDSLSKLYEMDEREERRVWLDKLLQFMDERGSPISACPTISKNPLDLFRLYLYVKERGGFMEVTKNKTWKDIAGQLGIGASSSAAYTLRKHYTKNLLAYECHFDRGGIDPQPIINQVEATSKKKGSKSASVPSPGSSNSQDSFPTPGSSGGASMDGYGGPGGGSYGYQPPGQGDYGSPPGVVGMGGGQQPPPPMGSRNPVGGSQQGGQPGQMSGAGGAPPSPHPGLQQGYQSQGPYSQYAPHQDQFGRGPPPPHPGAVGPMGQEFGQQYPGRPMYQPYGPEATDRGYSQQSGGPAQGSAVGAPPLAGAGGGGQDPYNRYMPGPGGQPQGYVARATAGYAAPVQPPPPTAGPNQQPPAPPGGYPGQQDYYRQDQVYPSQQQGQQGPQQGQPPQGQQPGGPPPVAPGAPPAGAQMYPGAPNSKAMPPPAPQPRRHPDFAKDQPPYPPYGQQRPPAMYPGWSNNSQYRGPYPQSGPGAPPPPQQQQWGQGPPRPQGGPPVAGQPPPQQPPSQPTPQTNNQWDQHRYPPGNQQSPYQTNQQWVLPPLGTGQSQPPPAPQQQQQQPPQQQWVPSMPAPPGIGQSSPLRPPLGPMRPPYRPDAKGAFPMPPPSGIKGPPGLAGGFVAPQPVPPQPLHPHQQPPQPGQSATAPSSAVVPPVGQAARQQGPAPPASAPPPLSQAPPPPSAPPAAALPPHQHQQPGYMGSEPHLPRMPRSPNSTPISSAHHHPPSQQQQAASAAAAAAVAASCKRELVFPPDSVEATTPILHKRRRLCRGDVAPVDAWRLMMCLRSGLLAETAYALDALSVLLFDDSSVAYFGLAHMPGLLDVLLEHFHRSLMDVFGADGGDLEGAHSPGTNVSRIATSVTGSCHDRLKAERKWYYSLSRYETPEVVEDEVDLGAAAHIDPSEHLVLLQGSSYTMVSRRGEPVKIVPRETDVFIMDGHRAWDEGAAIVGPEGVATHGATAETTTAPTTVVVPGDSTRYIVPCFRSEYGNVTFVRVLNRKAKESDKVDSEETKDAEDVKDSNSVSGSNGVVVGSEGESGGVVVVKEEVMSEDEGEKESEGEARLANGRVKQEVVDEEEGEGVGESDDASKVQALERLNCERKRRTIKNGGGDVVCIKKETVEDAASKDEDSVDTLKSEGTEDKSEEEAAGKTVGSNCASGGEEDNDGCSLVNGEKELGDSEEDSDAQKKSFTLTTHGSTLKIRDPAGTLKRRRLEDYEDECYSRDEGSLLLVTETQESLSRRCLCLSNILRNLTFVPGNESEFSRSPAFLSLLGKLLLLHHEHPRRAAGHRRNYDREEESTNGNASLPSGGDSLGANGSGRSVSDPSGEWWWDTLHQLREDVLVMAANVAGRIDLTQYPEEISRPLLDGLLHWAVCPAAYGQDPLPTVPPSSPLSPQRLALEALCKLCVADGNVDLVLATPPRARLSKLCASLARLLCKGEEQALREFAVNLLHCFAAADSGVARSVALGSPPVVSLLVGFVEQAEASALGVANQHGIQALRDNPEAMGTSLDMLRRAAGTLLHLARHPGNRPLFLQQEHRLLALVMSQILDQHVAAIISRVLYQCSRTDDELSS
ncbi:trithorax group protein osa [Ischnura elegans]|uniref:trithorax group protein osa n=1 Tax=Ischnura elegans TaxID=197161 RepID=UPI001ED89C5D|nr:trithorax group protein osa [Ischnura elegans]